MQTNKNREYKFGPNKPKYECTDQEWKRISGSIVWVDADENRKVVPVICPNCGATNNHKRDEIQSFAYNKCNLMTDKDGNKIEYECPGYIIMRFFGPEYN